MTLSAHHKNVIKLLAENIQKGSC